ncbi:uncharacterized protein LOC136028169 isoform X2 [Artemia franciscana]|uniref:Nucleolar pre-ribosomal-associated protein 1 n=1 Tax=Artemia franciscana TaxID=6661 RepID=A0AA88LE48_ARTSF|nr:hypothetical protein QYM36_007869 [Artemia franciscana]
MSENTLEDIQLFSDTVQQIEDENEALDCVVRFVNNGGCGKINTLLDNSSKKKGSELGIIFSSLESIFTRASSIQSNRLLGDVIKTAQNLVRNHLRLIYMSLPPSSSALQVKTTLRVLTAMVSINSSIAREIATTFNFDDPVIGYVLERRSLTNMPDCRTRYIQFIISFFLDEDTSILRLLLDRKHVIQSILPGLIYDDVDTVQLFLLALIEKVVQSSAISKTQKVKVFNQSSLDFIMKLYHWEGPEKFKKKTTKDKKKKSKEEDDAEPSDAWKESREAVAETVHELLVKLCSSHKHGIAFCDYSLGTSGRNFNPLCWHLVQKCQKPWEDEKLAELIMKTLSACPDLLRFYFDILGPIAAPRVGEKWKTFATFVNKVLASQSVSIVLGSHEQLGPKQLVMRASHIFLPPPTLANHVLKDSLVSEAISVQTLAVKIAVSILDKAVEFKSVLFGEKGNQYSEAEKLNVMKFLKDAVSKGMPYLDRYIECTSSVIDKLKKKETEINLEDIEIFHLLFKVFKYGDQFLFCGVTDLDRLYLTLLSDIIQIGNSKAFRGFEAKECWHKIQLEAIHLVASLKTVNSLSSALSKDTARYILQTVLSLYTSSKDVEIKEMIFSIYASFMCRDLAMSHVELGVWLDAMEDRLEIIDILAEASLRFLENPTFYVSQMRGLLAGTPIEQSDVKARTALIKAMMEEDFDPKSTVTSYDPRTIEDFKISPFIIAVKQVSDNKLPEEFWDDISRDFLSLESDVKSFQSVFSLILESLCSKERKKYISSWIDGSPETYKPKMEKKKLVKNLAKLQDVLIAVIADVDMFSSVENQLKILSCKIRANQTLVLNQCLFYLRRPSLLVPDKLNAMLKLIQIIVDESVTSGNDFIISHFLLSNTSYELFQVIDDEDQFLFEYTKVVLKFLSKCKENDIILRYQCKLHEQLQTLLSPLNNRNFNLELLESSIVILQLDSQKCLHLLGCVEFRQDKGSEHVIIASALLACFALNRLKNISQMPLETSLFAPICKFFVSGSADGEMNSLARAIRTYLIMYPTTLVGQTNDGECIGDIMSNWQVFQNWSSENEKLAYLLLSFRPEKYEKSFRQLLKCLRRKNSPEDNTKEVNVVYVRLLAAYLEAKEALHMEVNEKVAKEIRANYSGLFLQSLEDPEHFENLAREGNFNYSTVYNFLASSIKNQEIVTDSLNVLLNNAKIKPIISEQLLPVVHLGSCQTILQSMFNSVTSLCKQTLSAKILTKYFVGYGSLVESLPDLDTAEFLREKIMMTFIKTCLKFGLRLQESSNEDEVEEAEEAKKASSYLLELLNAVVYKWFTDEHEDMIELVYNMAASHSDFVSLMINDRNMHEKQKGALLKLLLTLTRKNSMICKTSHIPLYLSAYHATLDKLDQLVYQDSVQEVLTLLDPNTMKKTAEKFPVDLRLEPYVHEGLESSLYDPRFLLQSFYHLLSPDQLVPCQGFIENGCLSLMFSSLTSADEDIRALGYETLSRFYLHLEGARFYEKPLWLNLIDSLQHSLSTIGSRKESTNLRITSLIGLFISRAANIMSDSQEEMYKIVHNFLLVKPSLDIQQVPEFYILFGSSLPDYKMRRNWILHLLRDGFREHNDYIISSKRKIFRILMTFYDSPLCDDLSKVEVLEVLHAASKIPSAASDLVKNRGILTWIESYVFHSGKSSFVRAQLQHLTKLTVQLWKSVQIDFTSKQPLVDTKDAELLSGDVASENEEDDEPRPKIRKIVESNQKFEESRLSRSILYNQFLKLCTSLWSANYAEEDFIPAEAEEIIHFAESILTAAKSSNAYDCLPRILLTDFIRRIIRDCRRFIVYDGELVDFLVLENIDYSLIHPLTSELLCNEIDSLTKSNQAIRRRLHSLLTVYIHSPAKG